MEDRDGKINMTIKTIDIAKDFSKYPAGRRKIDGDFSAEYFRDDFLLPAFLNKDISKIILKMDDVAGYSSSFLEETFGGLVRKNLKKSEIESKIDFVTLDPNLKIEIKQYINEA